MNSFWFGWLGAITSIVEMITSFIVALILVIFTIRFIVKRARLFDLYCKKDGEEDPEVIKQVEIKIENIKNKEIIGKKSIILFIVCLTIFTMIVSLRAKYIKYAKPIIYLYPENETEITVKLGNEEYLDCTYPKYDDGWKVKAKPNGDLVDLKSGRKLYSLYWEGGKSKKPDFKEGFIIKGENTAKFLEEKLEILGLNYKETEEFIVYWLPKMEKNKYNYIRFLPQNEIDDVMPLIINPKPDTLIRVYMQFKGLAFPIKVEEQRLEKIEREGYTVVEWGGSEV